MQGYTYPQYVWMGYDWFPPKWWTYERSQVEVDCSDDELTNFIERALSFQWRPVPDDDNAITDTGKVSWISLQKGQPSDTLNTNGEVEHRTLVNLSVVSLDQVHDLFCMCGLSLFIRRLSVMVVYLIEACYAVVYWSTMHFLPLDLSK